MANKNETIQITCKLETYQLIHYSVVAAAKKAKQDGDEQMLLALRNALGTLCSADGITAHHLSNLSIWDVA